MCSIAKAIHRQQGLALVETVVVTPLLLFLMLATAEISNAFVDHNTLTKSVRGAARYVASNALVGTTGTVVSGEQLQKLEDEARNLVIYGNVSGSGVPRVRGLTSANVQIVDVGNNNLQLTASYPYSSILGATLPAFGFGSELDTGWALQATVVMKAL